MSKIKKDDSLEDIIATLASETNKNIKTKSLDVKAYIFSEESELQSDVKYFVSTGSTLLDIAISNRKNGGLPSGRIAEIFGLESTGKSLIAAHCLANVQKMGGIAVYIDIENAISREFLEAIGIDLSKLIYVPCEKIEDAFEIMENLIHTIRTKYESIPVMFVVDSIAAATTKVEMESDFQKDGYATTKAIVNSKAMRKLTNLVGKMDITVLLVNQLRENLSAMFGEKYTTSGGKAIGFHSSVRIKLSRLAKIKATVNQINSVIGIKTQAEIVKNRIGPPFRKAIFEVYFDRGIDDYPSWIDTLKTIGAFENSRTPYKLMLPSKDGKSEPIEYKIPKDGADKVFSENPDLREYCYNLIADHIIMIYKNKVYENITIEVEGSESQEPMDDE